MKEQTFNFFKLRWKDGKFMWGVFLYSPLLGKSLHLSYHPAGGRNSRASWSKQPVCFHPKKTIYQLRQKNMYKFIELNWPLCLKVILQNKALCDQNKGQLGSRKGNPKGTFSRKKSANLLGLCGLLWKPCDSTSRHLLISLSNFQSS